MKSTTRIAFIGLFGASNLFFPAVAFAGCPNLCDGSVAQLDVVPPLACATTEPPLLSECDCAMAFQIWNPFECAALQAIDFTFSSCVPSDGICTEVAPGARGFVHVPLDDLGVTRKTFRVRDAGGDHEITVAANVTNFGNGCSCTLAPRSGGTPLCGLLMLFGLFRLRRWRER